MGMQLTIESILKETLTKRAMVKVRRAARRVAQFIADRQLEINFIIKPDGLYETYRVKDKITGEWVDRYRPLSFAGKSHGHVGSPVPMRKIKKDTPYLEGI